MANSICACVNCSAKQEAGRNYILISGTIDNNGMHEKEIGVIFVAAFYVRTIEHLVGRPMGLQ